MPESARYFLNVRTREAPDWDAAPFRVVLALTDDLAKTLDLDDFCEERGLKWWISTRWDPDRTPFGDRETLVADLTRRFESRRT